VARSAKLATAIFFATITTIIAYLPLLMLIGNTGQFLRSPPIVMTSTRTRRRLALEPLCYAQIGGLAIATFITLQLVPVFYSIVCTRSQVDQMGNDTEPPGGH
jgi:multidrug efflux pump subunit AcrB